MQFRRASRVLTSWIAVLAILMAAVVPSISHALRAKAGASWIEICTSAGAKWVQPGDGADEKAPASKTHSFEHCPYCSLHASAIALPAAPVVLALTISASDRLPAAFLLTPRSLHSWARAQPRAPPQFS